MKIKNRIACVQDRGKWKDVVEKAKTSTPIKGSLAPRRRRRLSIMYISFHTKYPSFLSDFNDT
jgi:hypothetical protein